MCPKDLYQSGDPDHRQPDPQADPWHRTEDRWMLSGAGLLFRRDHLQPLHSDPESGPLRGQMGRHPLPGVPGPDNMDYQRGSAYHGLPAPDKDRFFVSCCHYASVIYCALAAVGRISPKALEKFNVDGWNMEMIGAEHSPGFENTAGSLGQTVSIAAKHRPRPQDEGRDRQVYCLMGDGELQEGQDLGVRADLATTSWTTSSWSSTPTASRSRAPLRIR